MLTDIQFWLEPIISSTPTVHAHSGFIRAFNAVFSDIEKVLIKDDMHNKKIFITGHSLGAALASLLTYRLIKEHKLSPILYTYACPPMGDKRFSKFFESLQSYTIINNGDVVSDAANELLAKFSIIGPWVGLYKPMQVINLLVQRLLDTK